MRFPLVRAAGFLGAALFCFFRAFPANGQPSHCAAIGPTRFTFDVDKPIALLSGMGTSGRAGANANAKAQSYARQGFAMLDSYMWVTAARSFREALRADERYASAWLGLSQALDALNRHEEARDALARAESAASKEGPDATFVRLRGLELAAMEAPGSGPARDALDAYRKAIGEALVAAPADAELWILSGRALERSPGGIGQNGGEESREAYETALRYAPGHPAAHHYLAHALENLGRYSEAAEHAKRYLAAAPRVPHAEHMLGHVLPRLGRWKEALKHLEASDALARRLGREQNLAPGEDWHVSHNLQLLGLVQLRLGAKADAERTLKRMYDEPIALSSFAWRRVVYPEALLHIGRAGDAEAAASKLLSDPDPLTRPAAAAVVGEAKLAGGNAAEARAAAESARALLAEATDASPDAKRSVTSYLQQLDAEIGLTGPSADKAERAIREYALATASIRRFDAWGEGDLRLARLAEQARRAGRPALADALEKARAVAPPEKTAGARD